jgi:hypothetical protein
MIKIMNTSPKSRSTYTPSLGLYQHFITANTVLIVSPAPPINMKNWSTLGERLIIYQKPALHPK